MNLLINKRENFENFENLTKKEIMDLEVEYGLTPLKDLEAHLNKSISIIKKQNKIIARTDSKL